MPIVEKSVFQRSLVCLGIAFMLLCGARDIKAQATCTTSSSGLMTCTGTFMTSGQSMFGLGAADISSSTSLTASWNATGSAGSISNPSAFGVSLGSYGAAVTGSSSGDVSFSANAIATGGTVSA